MNIREELLSNEYIDLEYEKNNNIIYAKKIYNNEFDGEFTFISSSEEIKSYTGDKKFFLGSGGIQNPDGLNKISLNNSNSLGKSPCVAIEIDVELESFSSKDISIVLGMQNNKMEAKDLAYKYSKINNCKLELDSIKKYWEDLLRKNKCKYTNRVC